MLRWIKRLSIIWEEYGFEVVVIVCVVAIVLLALYNWGNKGTWSSSYYYDPRSAEAPKLTRKKSDSKGELECRRVLREMFGRPFEKCRPNFLSNPVTGGNYNLEIDCWDEGLRIGVEYNGAQHYKYIPYFHKNKEHFLNQKYRDDMKRRICKENGVLLIEVPYTVPLDGIEDYLRQRLKNVAR